MENIDPHTTSEKRYDLSKETGPLPSPDLLAEYERLIPGSSKNFIQSYNNNRVEEIKYISKTAENNAKYRFLGILTGAVTVGLLSTVGGVLFIAGSDLAATALTIGGLAGGVVSYMSAQLATKESEKLTKEIVEISNISFLKTEDQTSDSSKTLI